MKTNDNQTAQRILIWGMALFLLGLLNGAAIPAFTNNRMGLSAHLAGVQNGMFLLIVGSIWHRIVLHDAWSKATATLAVFSMFGIWLALVVSAIWGTSDATPIAGAGFEASQEKELAVRIGLTLASVAAIISTTSLLVGLFNGKGSTISSTSTQGE